MKREEKIQNLLTQAFENISNIQKTKYVETPTTKNTVIELSKAIGKNFKSEWINCTIGQYKIPHDLEYEPVVSLITQFCSGYIQDVSEKEVTIMITTAATLDAKLKILAI